MRLKPILVTLVVGMFLTGSGILIAADKSQSKGSAQGMPGMEMKGMDHGMMHGEMMQGGMMDMMNSCKQMMSGGAMTPQLPAGNEKLQLQMHAEIMQKTGEIIAKYADKLAAGARSTP